MMNFAGGKMKALLFLFFKSKEYEARLLAVSKMVG